ncbi:MAG: hypothetical protein HGA54_08135, partial [Actinobacteria bacterium]|nr:hypothetical protein [Actinomycetota bacterium]
KDDRAAPLLESRTGDLRATLPLFERRSLRLGDEVDAAARYLEVMRLRLGVVGYWLPLPVTAVFTGSGPFKICTRRRMNHD